MLTEDKKAHVFKKDASFEIAFKLYCFDKKLRKLIFSEIEKIEVAVRARIIYELSHAHGSFWLNNDSLFSDKEKYERMFNEFKKVYVKCDEIFIKSFKGTYDDKWPPSWILLEIVSFGNISQIYSNLKPSREKREIANSFGLNDRVFAKWLHTLTYIRNVCAHHSRLWNRKMSIQATMPLSPKKMWINNTDIRNDKMYFILCMIIYLQQSIHQNHKIKAKLLDLLSQYSNVDLSALGFPNGWEKEPIWEK